MKASTSGSFRRSKRGSNNCVVLLEFFALPPLLLFNVKLPLSYVTLVFLLLHTGKIFCKIRVKVDRFAAVLEEPVNVSTNSAVICWSKPEANSPVKLYTLKVEQAHPGDTSGIQGSAVFSVDVDVIQGKDRYCQSVDNLEEDTKYLYTVTAMHSNGLAVQNVDRQSFSTKANSCSTQVCSGGTCSNINEPPYFNCMCYLGYYGRACENYNPCVNMPCAPYECINITTNQFECICPNGAKYTDVSDCDEHQKDPCKEEPCQNEATCINLEGGDFACQCSPGWRGKRCEKPDRCHFVTCQNKGTCVEVLTNNVGFMCKCPPGTSGDFCEEAGPCKQMNCLNEGSCQVDVVSGEASCSCQEGWHGTRCELEDPCHQSRNPCQNGAVCEASVDSQDAVCRCEQQYYGAFCQFFDPCAAEEKCNNHGVCNYNTQSGTSFTCSCEKGWSGEFCQDQNLCIAGDPCKNGGQCTYLGHNKYSCACLEQSGFWGPNCQYYNQCHKHPCRNGAQCRNITSDNNSDNDYLCLCDANYEGKNCDILNLCKKENYCGRGTCAFKGHNQATCECQLGYYGDRCEHYDVCKVRNPCQNGGECEATADNGYKCKCLHGYSGPDCDKFDPCSKNPCLNDGLCVVRDDRLGIYECKCKDKYSSGFRCEFLNPCMEPNKCPESFVCLNTSTEHAICRPGDPTQFPIGSTCIKDADCFNGGTCSKKGVCTCKTPYEGSRCENINPCNDNEPSICSRRGRCQRDSPVNARCECDEGFFGARCQYQDKCLAKQCLNGGNCVLLRSASQDQASTPKCHCRDGYNGDNCEIANKQCTLNLCENGGKCLTLGFVTPQYQEGYVCECPIEYYGPKCQKLRTCPATPPLDLKSIGALRWPETGAGNVSKIVCPYGSRRPGGRDAIESGFATRSCVIRESNHLIQVEWGDINYKFCQNEPKSLTDAKSILNDMIRTLSETPSSEITVDTIRYCSQVLHNLLAAFTLTDRKMAQDHVYLVNQLINARPEVIYAAEGNYSTSHTIVEDLESLARRFVMATEEVPFQVSSSSSGAKTGGAELTNQKRELKLQGTKVNVIIITEDTLSAATKGMKYAPDDGYVSVFVPPAVFQRGSSSSSVISSAAANGDRAPSSSGQLSPTSTNFDAPNQNSQLSLSPQSLSSSKSNTLQQSSASTRTHRLQVITYTHDFFFNNPTGAKVVPGGHALDGLYFPTGGRVVSVSLDDKQPVRDLNSRSLIEISFPLIPTQKAEPLCVFWKEDARYWSQTGLDTKSFANRTLCKSSHLTTFTLLMRVMSMNLEAELAPSILPFVGTGLAIIAYTLTIITYCLFGSLRREASGNVVLSLAAALLLLNISFLAAAVRTRFQDQHLCNAVGVALHFFLLASVMWHVVDALFSYNNVARPIITSHHSMPGASPNSLGIAPSNATSAALISAAENQVSTSLFIKCALFAWGMPLIITTPTIIIKQGNYDIRDIYCRLTPELETTYYGALVLPCSVIILVGVLFHLIALKKVQTQAIQHKNFQLQQMQYPSHERAFLESTRLNLLTMTLVLLSFSVTWIYAQFFFSQSLPTFEFVFCCGNVFQSWCFFTSRCMLLREARDAWKMFFSAGEMKPHVVADSRRLKCNAYDDGVGHALLQNQSKAVTPEKYSMGANHHHAHLNGGHPTIESPFRHVNSNGHSGHAIPETVGFEKDFRETQMALNHRGSPISSTTGSQNAVIFGETMEIKKAAAQAFGAPGSSSKSVTDESVREEDEFIRATPGHLPHPDQYWHETRISTPPTSGYVPSPPLSDPNRESYV